MQGFQLAAGATNVYLHYRISFALYMKFIFGFEKRGVPQLPGALCFIIGQ